MGIRAIAFVGENLWVANEDVGIVVVNPLGEYIGYVSVKKPIGLLYVHEKSTVYVTSKHGKVYAVHSETYSILYELKQPFGWKHPTGMARDGNLLYIADLKLGIVSQFNLDTARYLQIILSGIVEIEQLAISHC
jgi:outer membrane protein assembly factor BamB